MLSFHSYFDELCRIIQGVDEEALNETCRLLRVCRDSGGKVVIAGNGGSAAIASHVSVDLVKAAGVRAMCFNEAGLITCFANDFGYEHWVEKAVEYYGESRDVAVLISSSGESRNIINGAEKAKSKGLDVVTMSGFRPDNPLRSIGDVNFWVDSSAYNYVENAHQIWLLGVVDRLEAEKQEANPILVFAKRWAG